MVYRLFASSANDHSQGSHLDKTFKPGYFGLLQTRLCVEPNGSHLHSLWNRVGEQHPLILFLPWAHSLWGRVSLISCYCSHATPYSCSGLKYQNRWLLSAVEVVSTLWNSWTTWIVNHQWSIFLSTSAKDWRASARTLIQQDSEKQQTAPNTQEDWIFPTSSPVFLPCLELAFQGLLELVTHERVVKSGGSQPTFCFKDRIENIRCTQPGAGIEAQPAILNSLLRLLLYLWPMPPW